jgi:CelD/BcsL family acetyltransferase involved in cellulose biosynthesis
MVKLEIAPDLSPAIESRWAHQWNCWPTAHIFNHPTWYRIVKGAQPHLRSLVIVAATESRDLLFMTAQERGDGLQLAGSPYLDKGSLLWDPDLSDEAWRGLTGDLLSRYHWVRFQEMTLNGPWKAASASDHAPMLCRSSENPYFSVSSPRLSAKQRHELRRYTNLLRRQGSLEVCFRKMSPEDIEVMGDIEGHSTKLERNRARLTDTQYVRWLQALLHHLGDCCWIALMSLNRKPIAHYMGLRAHQTLLGIHMAFRKEYARFSPGNVLIFNVLPLLEERGVKNFDFGRGPSLAKTKFAGDAYVTQYDVYYFRKSWAGRRARLRTRAFWFSIGVRRLLRRRAGHDLNSLLDRLPIRR